MYVRMSRRKVGSGLERRKVFQSFSDFSDSSRFSNRHKTRGTRISETGVLRIAHTTPSYHLSAFRCTTRLSFIKSCAHIYSGRSMVSRSSHLVADALMADVGLKRCPGRPLPRIKPTRPHLSHPLHRHNLDTTSRFLFCESHTRQTGPSAFRRSSHSSTCSPMVEVTVRHFRVSPYRPCASSNT
jgi:hypothetical protein